MNAVSIDIKDILVAAGIGLTFGTNLFISQQPDSPVNVVTIYDTSSTPPDGTLDGQVFLRDSVMLMIRNVSYQSAFQVAQQIFDVLHNKNNFVAGGANYLSITLLNGPNSLNYDEDTENTHLTVNYIIQRKK